MGHSRSPECSAPRPAREARGRGPGTNLGGSGAEMFIASRCHVSICIGVIWNCVGESTTRA